MALSPTAIAPVNDPNSLITGNSASKVYEVLSGTTTNKNDADSNNQILRNQTHTLNEVKVAKAGDTMTGLLTINQGTLNTTALVAAGNGTGYGINATGGATGGGAIVAAGGGNNIGCYGLGRGTEPGIQGLGGSSGAGGKFISGGGNASGVTTTGDGTGAGIACTGGATGPGLTAVNGTAQTTTAPTCAAQLAGYLQLTGADPNNGIDPGANNVLHAANIPKAWVTFDTGYNILKSYNVATITTVLGDIKKLTFVRAMANAQYAVTIQQHGAPGGLGAMNTNVNTSDFDFVLYKSNDLSLGFVAGATAATIVVFGLQ